MLDYPVLGTIQGIFEWIPVSSEGMITLASGYMGIASPLQLALYLHLGTVLAVIAYFWKEIRGLPKDPGLTRFLSIAMLASLAVGFPITYCLKRSHSTRRWASSLLESA